MTEEKYLKSLDKANIILGTEYCNTKLDELEELCQIIQTYEEKLFQKNEQSKTLLHRKPYTFEDIRKAWEVPTPMTAKEIEDTFITDNEPIDLSKLKIKKI